MVRAHDAVYIIHRKPFTGFMIEIELCHSCLKDADKKPKKFRKKVERVCQSQKVELTSCLKVCPKRGLAFAVRVMRDQDGQLLRSVRTFVKEADVDEVAAEVRAIALAL